MTDLDRTRSKPKTPISKEEEIFTFSPRINSVDSRSARERRAEVLSRSISLYKDGEKIAEKKKQLSSVSPI